MIILREFSGSSEQISFLFPSVGLSQLSTSTTSCGVVVPLLHSTALHFPKYLVFVSATVVLMLSYKREILNSWLLIDASPKVKMCF